MHEKEINYFTTGLQLANDEFYLDAMNQFRSLVTEFPDSELCDDAIFNLGLCFFQMNQFEKAIEQYERVINDYPEATISILDGGNEYGKTSAKCWYAIMNCYLGTGNIEKAESVINELDQYPESYIQMEDGQQKTFKELAKNSLNVYQKGT